MFKKLLSFILICIISIPLVACGSAEEKENEKEKPKEITFTENEEKDIIENIKLMCEGTAYNKADFIIHTELQEDFTKYNNVLKVIVIKNEDEVLEYYKSSVPETEPKESIKKSLTLDTAISAASDSVDKIKQFDRIVAVLYSTEDDYKNDNSYAVDTLNI